MKPTEMKIRKILLWSLGILAGWLLVGCGPSMEELEAKYGSHWEDSLKAHQDDDLTKPFNETTVTVTTPAATPSSADATPPQTYSASDFGLTPGRVVRWVPRSIPDDVNSDLNFPEVYIHIEGPDGVTKVFRANWNIWQNLVTGDTLR